MNAARFSDNALISRRVRDVRDSWTPGERRQRADEGKRRFEQFVQLIDNPGADEIWAGGALTAADFERIMNHAS